LKWSGQKIVATLCRRSAKRARRGQRSQAERRNFYKLDAAVFLAQKVPTEPELLPPRKIAARRRRVKGTD